MIESIRDQWVAALESGHYKQERRFLRDGDRFCCLGVLCDIVGGGEWSDNGYYVRDGVSQTSFPHQEILDTIQLDFESVRYLSQLNDQGYSFEEIAQYIKENF